MSYTIPQLPATATAPATDDYLELGGSTNGSRKFLASSFVLTTDSRLSSLGTVTSVQASGGSTGLSFSGGPVTVSGTLLLGGVLNTASGGSGSSSPSLVAGNSINLSGSWPAQTIALSATPNIGDATGNTITLSNAASQISVTRTDGSYQYRLKRTGTNAREYGLAISGSTGEFALNDITAGASRIRVTTAGTIAFDGPVESIGPIRTTGSAVTDLASSAAIDFISGKARLWSWGPDNSTYGTLAVRVARANGGGVEPALFTSTGVAINGNLSVSGMLTVAGVAYANAALTMSDLRALDPSSWANGTVVTLLGYLGPDDGGGGDFSWQSANTLSDDGGCIIRPTAISGNGRFIRVLAGVCYDPYNTLLGSEFNVRWFGAIPVFTNCTPGFLLASAAAKRVSTYQASTIYFPPGCYKFESPVDETYSFEVTLKGVGSASRIECAVASYQTAFAKFAFHSGGGIIDLNFTQSNFPTSALHGTLLWIHDSANAIISRVQVFGTTQYNSNTAFSGDILKLTNNQYHTVSNILVRGSGTALHIDGGSGTISGSTFITETQTPALWVSGCNSISIQDSFFQGGGPWKSYYGATITSTPSYFTVSATNHGYASGDYMLLRGFTKNGYNTLWKVRDVPDANTFTVLSTFNLGSDSMGLSGTIVDYTTTFVVTTPSAHGYTAGQTVVIRGASNPRYNQTWTILSVTSTTITVSGSGSGNDSCTISTQLSPPWSSALFGAYSSTPSAVVTESSVDNCLFNSSGIVPGGGSDTARTGSVGIYVTARGNNVQNAGGLKFGECTMDYGNAAFFLHGISKFPVPSPVIGGNFRNISECTVGSIVIDSCGPNGGPRDYFGSFRFEAVSGITVSNSFMAADDHNKPSTGNTFNSVVISDGGTGYGHTGFTQDFNFTGGIYMLPSNDLLAWNADSITGFTFDGPNVRRVSVVGVSLDTSNNPNNSGAINTFPVQYVNGASTNNGISVVYANSTGSLQVPKADILSGNAVLSILQAEQVKLIPETGYRSGGPVTLAFDGRTSAYIQLTVNATFSSSGLASGNYIFLALKNTTGGLLTIAWPGTWSWAGVSVPTSLASGASLLLRIFAFGITDDSVIATY